MREIRAIVTGKVQGVSFRDFVSASAQKLGVNGYVRNLPDGTVQVMAQAGQEELNAFLDILHTGPPLSRVEAVRIEWREPSNMYPVFQIEY